MTRVRAAAGTPHQSRAMQLHLCPAAARSGLTYAPMLSSADEVPPGAPTVLSAGPGGRGGSGRRGGAMRTAGRLHAALVPTHAHHTRLNTHACTPPQHCRTCVAGAGHKDDACLVHRVCSHLNHAARVWPRRWFSVTHVYDISAPGLQSDMRARVVQRRLRALLLVALQHRGVCAAARIGALLLLRALGRIGALLHATCTAASARIMPTPVSMLPRRLSPILQEMI